MFSFKQVPISRPKTQGHGRMIIASGTEKMRLSLGVHVKFKNYLP